MDWSVDDYAKNASFVYQYGDNLLMLLNPISSELVEKIASKGCKVTASDSSKEIVNTAQKNGNYYADYVRFRFNVIKNEKTYH